MRFEFIRILGTGAHGTVELHRDHERGGAYVALKRLHSHVQITAENEIELALQVTHRNVGRVNDIHREGGAIVISMEYVEGETLREIMRRSTPLPLDDALKIFGQLVDGMEEAHAQGVIHRDLKPENVMVTRDGVVKIMDFGLAMRVGLTVGARGQANPIAGTPGYMAPEQADGDADKRTDIYQLGALLYEMVTGNGARKKSRVFPKSVPAGLRSMILKCLEKNPDDRFQSVAELRSAPEEPVPPVRRGLKPATTSGTLGILGICLLLTVGLAGALWTARRQPAAEVSESKAPTSVPAPAPASPPR